MTGHGPPPPKRCRIEPLPPEPRPKPRPTLIPADVLLAVAQLLAEQQPTRGDGWRDVPAEDHLDAAMRHLLRHQAGDLIDESGHPHLVHALARLMMAYSVAADDARDGGFFNHHDWTGGLARAARDMRLRPIEPEGPGS